MSIHVVAIVALGSSWKFTRNSHVDNELFIASTCAHRFERVKENNHEIKSRQKKKSEQKKNKWQRQQQVLERKKNNNASRRSLH